MSMNNGVICSNCNTENAFGAKFCVHCGRSIRTTSVRICTSCQTENAGSDSTCWQCGAVLPKLTGGLRGSAGFAGIPGQEADDEMPAASPDEGPDEEGGEEIDWSSFGQQEHASYDSNFPDWLLGSDALQQEDESAEPIITEAFPDLENGLESEMPEYEDPEDAGLSEWLGSTSEDDDVPASAEDPAGMGGALTDWLAELGETSDVDTGRSAAGKPVEPLGNAAGDEPAEPMQDPLDWLSEFGSLNTDILSLPISDQPESEEQDDDDSLDAWLSRIGQAKTDLLSDPSDHPQLESEQPGSQSVSDPPNWAVELGLTETGGFSISATGEGVSAEESDDEASDDDEPAVLPPWLEDSDKTNFLPELVELHESQLEDTEADDEAELPEWLKDAEEIEDETRMTGYLPSEPKFDLEADDDQDLPDWLEGIDEQELIQEAPAAPPPTRTLSPKGVLSEDVEDEQYSPTPDGGVTLPPWITTEDQSRSSEEASEFAVDSAFPMADAQLPPWLTGSEEGEPEPPTDSELKADLFDSRQPASSDDDAGASPDDQLPDWVNDFDEIELPDEAAAPEEDTAEAAESEEDMPEWLTEPGLFEIDRTEPAPAVEDSIEADADLPDWLISTDEEEETPPEIEPSEPVLRADDDEELIPDWLSEPEFEAAADAGADDQLADDFDLSSDEALPSWLSEEDARDSGTDEELTLEQPAFGETDDQSDDSIESDWLMAFEETDNDAGEDQGISPDELPDWMAAELPVEPQGDEQEAIESELGSDWLQPEPVESEGISAMLDEPAAAEEAARPEADLTESDMAIELDDLTITELDTDFGFTAWLSDLGEDEAEEQIIRGTALLDDLLVADPNIIKTELGWLEDVEDDEPALEESTLGMAPIAGDEVISEKLGPVDADDEAPLTDQPEWLTAWESSGGELLEPLEDEEIPELQEDIFAKLEQTFEVEPAALEADKPPVEAELVEAQPDFADHDDDWLVDGMLSSDGLEPAEIPDWLEQMEPTGASDGVPTPKPDMVEPAADLPDWIADLKPTRDTDMGSILPSALTLPDEEDTLIDITEDVAAEQLPHWLQSGDQAALDGDALTLPLAAVREEHTSWREAIFQDSDAGQDDWEEILGDLPPSLSPAEELVQAEIPDWVQQLMPPVLKGEPEETAEAVAEETGPLAGLSGVIDTADIAAVAHSTEPLDQFTITKEQQQQAALLRQLTRAERQPAQVDLGTIHTTSTWTRMILAGLLFIAVAAGLLLPDLLKLKLPSAQVEPVQELVDAAAGKSVLVAFEYTPAMAGELSPQAEAVLARLSANGSPMATVSQYSTGMALAGELTAGLEVNPVGLITGEAIGLRQLGNCLGRDAQCQRILGRSLDAELQDQLREVELIILFTSDHDSLVNWIEQVGGSSDVPMLAGVTQSLMPTASPYLESGQLRAVINGIYEAAALQAAAGESGLNNRVQAVGFGQLAAALLLLTGGIFMGSSKKKTSKPANTKSST